MELRSSETWCGIVSGEIFLNIGALTEPGEAGIWPQNWKGRQISTFTFKNLMLESYGSKEIFQKLLTWFFPLKNEISLSLVL